MENFWIKGVVVKARVIDIGVEFDEPMDTSFMDDIMKSGIADSGLESNGDVFFEDTLQGERMSDEEFDAFLRRHGISLKEFREW